MCVVIWREGKNFSCVYPEMIQHRQAGKDVLEVLGTHRCQNEEI